MVDICRAKLSGAKARVGLRHMSQVPSPVFFCLSSVAGLAGLPASATQAMTLSPVATVSPERIDQIDQIDQMPGAVCLLAGPASRTRDLHVGGHEGRHSPGSSSGSSIVCLSRSNFHLQPVRYINWPPFSKTSSFPPPIKPARAAIYTSSSFFPFISPTSALNSILTALQPRRCPAATMTLYYSLVRFDPASALPQRTRNSQWTAIGVFPTHLGDGAVYASPHSSPVHG